MSQTLADTHYVLLGASGKLTFCSGGKCPYSNAGEGTPTLAKGKTLRVGRFSCSARAGASRCIVVQTGRGFQMTSAGARGIPTA